MPVCGADGDAGSLTLTPLRPAALRVHRGPVQTLRKRKLHTSGESAESMSSQRTRAGDRSVQTMLSARTLRPFGFLSIRKKMSPCSVYVIYTLIHKFYFSTD